MLIKLSNGYLINPETINYVTPRLREQHEGPRVTEWCLAFNGENRLTLSQTHFDELMACLPTPVEASGLKHDTVSEQVTYWKEH